MTPGLSRRSSIDATDDLLGIPVLASIPTMLSPREREQRRRRRRRMTWMAAVILVVILLVLGYVFLR